MWEPVSLPYKSATCPPLPSASEIRACPDLLLNRRAKKIAAMNEDLVAKFGSRIRDWEGQALIYLERYVPEVPAPRLYAMYHDDGELFLLMQRAPGVQLDSLWPTMAEPEKSDIIGKLRSIFDIMRRAPCPLPEFFGGLDYGSVHDDLFRTSTGYPEYLGPFTGQRAFVMGLVENYRAFLETNGRIDYKLRFYETHLPQVLQGNRPTLTHGDFQQKNIMVAVKQDSGDVEARRSFDIMIVDWETAGWYPEFWEYFLTSLAFDFWYWEDDWGSRVEEFLTAWPAQMAIMRMIYKDLGFY